MIPVDMPSSLAPCRIEQDGKTPAMLAAEKSPECLKIWEETLAEYNKVSSGAVTGPALIQRFGDPIDMNPTSTRPAGLGGM